MFKNILKILCLAVLINCKFVLSVEGFIGKVDYSYGSKGNLIEAKYYLYEHIGADDDSVSDSITITAVDTFYRIEYVYNSTSSYYVGYVENIDLNKVNGFVEQLNNAYKNWIKIACSSTSINVDMDLIYEKGTTGKNITLEWIKNRFILISKNNIDGISILQVPIKVTPTNVQIKYLLSEEP